MDIDKNYLKIIIHIIILLLSCRYIIYRRVNYLRFDVIYVNINLSQHHTLQFYDFGIFSFFFLII